MMQRMYCRLEKFGWGGASSSVLTKCHYGQQTKENEMGKTYGTHGGDEKCVVKVRKHEGKKPIGRSKRRPQETLNGSLTNRKWIGLTCHKTKISRGILRVVQNARNLSASSATISLRKDSAPCGYFIIQGVDSHSVYTVPSRHGT